MALCAAFTVHKIPSLIHDNPDSEIYHCLSCYLTTDTGFWITKNFHVITASEYNRFIWLNQRRFIWLSYIPRGSFSDSLNKWNNLKAHFVSNSQDLEVHKCGHRLVYKKKILDFVATIVQCATTSPHKFGLTNQFEGDENRNNKQGHVDEGETSETPLCIDYQKIRKWTNFLQKHSEVRLFLCLSVFFSFSHSLSLAITFLFYRSIIYCLNTIVFSLQVRFQTYSAISEMDLQ